MTHSLNPYIWRDEIASYDCAMAARIMRDAREAIETGITSNDRGNQYLREAAEDAARIKALLARREAA